MPELCEVQIMTENLMHWSVGKQLIALDIVDQKLLNTIPEVDLLRGQIAQKVWRRAKYTVLTLESHTIIFHYRMTGKLVLEDEERRFIRLRLRWADAGSIVFSDARRFGEVHLLRNEHVSDYFASKKLGDEPWKEGAGAKTGEWWSERLGTINSPIKPVMLRQDKVVGLGNILASEICFRARVNPTTKASLLSSMQWNQIAIAAQSCIEEILEEERSEEIGYVSQGNDVPASFRVYNRAGSPCVRCGSQIEAFRQHSRTTYWCSSCQQSDDP